MRLYTLVCALGHRVDADRRAGKITSDGIPPAEMGEAAIE